MNKLMLVGYPIDYAVSPTMHNAALRAMGLHNDFDYTKLRLRTDELSDFVERVRAREIVGANVTVPHKMSILPYLDALTPEATMMKAVNTIWWSDGAVFGHNTDGLGCMASLLEAGVRLSGKHVLILGAGGAARAVAFALSMAGITQLTVLNRTESKARDLATEVSETIGIPGTFGGLHDCIHALKVADILIHCTSVGMRGSHKDQSLVGFRDLRPEHVVLDVVYNPITTALLREAAKAGATAIDGIGMLVHQGAEGLQLWTRRQAPLQVMRSAVEEILR